MYDLIVIGSSFGGVMAAWPSVMAGKRVLMIERGDWVPRGPQNRGADGFFTLTPAYSSEAPYRVIEGGDSDTLGTIACVGGASVFFGGVSLRLRERDFVHDPEIDAAVFNHVSGYMADVVWHGLSTYHVRSGFGDNLHLDELRQYWMPVSPMAYMEKLASLPPRPQRYIYTLYDLSFPVELSRDVMRELRRRKIPHSKAAIPCGHYTLGEKPWVYLDGYKIISYLHKHLK